jgi:hypothetical protein
MVTEVCSYKTSSVSDGSKPQLQNQRLMLTFPFFRFALKDMQKIPIKRGERGNSIILIMF